MAPLCKGLSECETVEELNLSFNGINEESGFLVALTIKAHSERRDDQSWKKSLRKSRKSISKQHWHHSVGSIPIPKWKLTGLLKVDLSNNYLKKGFMKELAKVMQLDNYIKVVDLANNEI